MMELPEGSEDRCKRPLVAIMSRLMSDLLIYYVSIGVDLFFVTVTEVNCWWCFGRWQRLLL
jgi:hypothetical protein